MRSSQPSSDLDAPPRVVHGDRILEPRHPPSGEADLRQYEDPTHLSRHHAEALAHEAPSGESDLLVEPAGGRLERNELGLDLHHERGPRRRMHCEDVDRPAFAELRVRDLPRYRPSEASETPGNPADERCVPLVEEAIELTATPRDVDDDTGVDCRKHACDRPERERVPMPPFDQRHARLADAGDAGQVALAPSASPTERPKHTPDPHAVHERDLRAARSPAAHPAPCAQFTVVIVTSVPRTTTRSMWPPTVTTAE